MSTATRFRRIRAWVERASPRLLTFKWPLIAAAVSAQFVLAAVLLPIERGFQHLRGLSIENEPTGEVVIVEADASDIARSGTWPIDRRTIAEVLVRLAEAGVERVFINLVLAFDREGDAELIEALKLFGPERVALPIINKYHGPQGEADNLAHARPIAALTDKVSLRLLAAEDGVPERFAESMIGNRLAPSAIAWLAGKTVSDSPPVLSQFDYNSDLKHLTFSDVLAGTAEVDLRGARVVLGIQGYGSAAGYQLPWQGFVSTVRLIALGADAMLAERHVERLHRPWAALFAGSLAFVLTLVMARAKPLWLIVLPSGGFFLGLSLHIELFRAGLLDFELSAFAVGVCAAALSAIASRGETLIHQAAKSKEQLAQQSRMLQTMIDRHVDGCMTLALDGTTAYRNAAAEVLLAAEGGRTDRLADGFGAALDEIQAMMAAGENGTIEVEIEGKETILEVGVSVLGDQGEPFAILVMRDVTVQRRRTKRLERQAFVDELTGCPNRRAFDSEIELLQQGPTTTDGSRIALFVIDLDGFKAVNDTLGHAAGDKLLKVAARRMCDVTPDSAMVARLGGDEFGIILRDVDCQNEARSVARLIVEALEEPIELGDDVATIGGSVGVAMAESPNEPLTSVLHRADEAMYVAKRGRLGVHLAQDEVASVC